MKFARIDVARYHPEAGQKVIKADDHEVLCYGNSLVRHAKREAEHLTRKARLAYEQAEEAGYEAGLEQAREEMLSRYLRLSREAIGQLARLEESLVDLVGRCLLRILGEIPQPEQVALAARQLMRTSELSGPVRLRVSERALAQVQAAMVELEKGLESLQVDVDHRLDDDAFVLESNAGLYYGAISEQLDTMLEGFAELFRGGA